MPRPTTLRLPTISPSFTNRSGPRSLFATFALSVAAACGGGGASGGTSPPTLQSISLSPAAASVAKGLTRAFTATGHHSDGSTQDLTALAAWSSSDGGVATESNAAGSQGLATGTGIGQATISAVYGGQTGQATLTVTAAVLQSLSVAPASASVAAGLITSFTATGSYSDGSTQDLTALATWSSSDATIATVSGETAAGVKPGQAVITAAYGGLSGDAVLTVDPPVLQSVAVAPASASVAAGLTAAFAATGIYSDGSTQDVTLLAAWSSSDVSVATVSTGLATGKVPGQVAIDALYDGQLGTASLQVTAPVLQSVAVSPGAASIAKGLTQAFTASGSYSDGSTQDLTSSATWSSSDTAVATVSSGVATGTGTGTATISAASGGQSGQATLTVTGAVVQSVSLSPASASVPVGLTQAFTANAHWSDGSTSDVTATASWTTLDPGIATATGSVVKGVSVGSTQVQATAQGATGSASFAVTPAVVQAVTVSPANASLAAGMQLQYSAEALYSDGSKQDVTASAAWASSNAAAASVDAAGLATGVAPGTATISATFSSVAGTTPLTVTAATLTSISISPSEPSVPAGFLQAFTATGIFSDGTNEDLTAQVTWTSSAPSVATISAAGVATALATGSTSIGAAYGLVSAATTLTVTSATLTALTVLPVSASIAKGTTVACAAVGTYSDGTTQDLTALATWTSSGPAVTVSSAPGSQGVATGAAVGTADVTASYGGLSDFSTVTVTSAVVQSIAIAPSGATVPAGTTQALAATGTFSDGTTQDLTALASWTSSDTAVAAVSNAAGTSGVVTALAPGSVTITAAYSGVSGTAPLTVSPATLVSIQVSPADASLPVTYTLQYQALGTFSDGSTRDLTALATWVSSNPTVATVSSATGSQGLATGVGVGTTTISATFSSVTGTTGLAVTNTRLQSIAVTPNPFSVAVGATLQFAALGTFQDGTVLDITRQVGWSIPPPRGIATISHTGLLTGTSAGSVTVTAKKTGKTATASGTVY